MKVVAVNLVMIIALSIAYPKFVQAQAQGAPDYIPPNPELEVENLDKLKRTGKDDMRGVSHLQALKGAAKLINDLQLACELTDVRPSGSGSAHVNGEEISVESYEVACSNGTGYILISQVRQQATVISCFAASQSMENDANSHGRHRQRKSTSVSCQLPVNQDTNAMATNLLAGLSAKCTATGVNTFGVNAKNHTEYVEVACTNNIGYVLAIPQKTDVATQISVMSCQDAAHHGLQCKLTNNSAVASPAPVTMQTLYDALKQHGITCTSTQLQLRLIGKEAAKKRYVVETRCPEQPGGLVAYIPLEDNSNKFETIDCNEALKRQITCQFNSK